MVYIFQKPLLTCLRSGICGEEVLLCSHVLPDLSSSGRTDVFLRAVLAVVIKGVEELPVWQDLVTFVETELRPSPKKKKSPGRGKNVASKRVVLDLGTLRVPWALREDHCQCVRHH